MIIDRFDVNGNSIANRLYHLVDNEVIGLKAKVIADGSKRLDQYATLRGLCEFAESLMHG